MDFNYRPTSPLLSSAQIEAERQALTSGRQRNALMQLQVQQAQAAAQDQVRRNALMQEFQQSLPSPQMLASQQALSAGGGPTVANAARMPAVDPRLDIMHRGMKAGAVSPLDYANAAFPAPKAPDYKVVGDALVQIGPQGVREAYKGNKAPTLPPGMQMGPNGPEWIPGYLDGKARVASAGAAQTSVNYSQPVEAVDAQGNRVFIRTTKSGLEPAVIPGVRPPMSAAEERSAGEKSQRERQGKQMVSAMQDARTILSAGRATESGVGNVVDAAGRMVGVTTVGAQDAARLEALSGWLVANVPRMEGPQSNFDVQNYTTMAGKIGDRTVPIPERLAALAEVERLQRKYAEINGTPIPDAPKPAAPKSPRELFNEADKIIGGGR